MSKTILLSTSIETAADSETGLEFGDDVLNILWPEVNRMKANYPIIWKIVEDFYDDFTVEPIELQQLRKEIQQLIATLPDQIEVVIWLETLKTLTNLGITYHMTLVGIAD